jgi:polyphosphate glucokinase
MEILGIDIGGSGIKGAPVVVETGETTAERFRLDTPQPSAPPAVADAVAAVARQFEWRGPIGVTYPGVVHHGVVHTAANVDKSWIGVDGQRLFAERTGCPVLLLNDADAAGIAEMRFGAGKGQEGVVIVLTFGTGIGSAVFLDGKLLPNTEFGHMEVRGKDAEEWASDRARKDNNLKWEEWAALVEEFLKRLELLFSPDLFVVGGGVSKKHDKFLPLLHIDTPIVPAATLNEAGIIGAALAAARLGNPTP